MDARTILARLSDAGVSVTLEGTQIRCRPASAIPAALGALVAARKSELIKLLEQPAPPPAAECSHNGLPRVEWRQYDGGKHLGELCGLCGKWLRWMRQDEAALATVSAGKPAPWLHPGPTRVHMEAPGPGDGTTREDAITRREAYFRSRWAGADHANRMVDLPADTCIVCGCHPIVQRGDYRCALCIEAAAMVLEERKRSRDAMRGDVEAVFGQHPTTQVSDFDAFKSLCGRRWGGLSSEDRMEHSLEFLADIIEFYIEAGSKSGEARARAVWARLEAICERWSAAR